ncbi:MAG: hypothetical protein MJZ37_06545 [Bacilli bacterium]|nr:hypothetical protein [Bacilli bacterium]
MKKKIKILVGSLVLLLSACNGSTNNNQQPSGETINESSKTEEKATIKNLNEMVDFFVKEKLVYGEKSIPSYFMLSGVIAGVKYNNNSDFYAEIYEYSSKAPSKASILGIEFSYSAVNGRFALIVNQMGSTTKTSKETKLLDCFKSLNTK